MPSVLNVDVLPSYRSDIIPSYSRTMSGEENKLKGASGSSATTGLNIQLKSTVRPSTGQPEKRTHSEVARSSFGDEISMIDKQLKQMNIDLQETRESVKELLSKEEMKTFIVSTIQALNSELEKKIDKVIEKKS